MKAGRKARATALRSRATDRRPAQERQNYEPGRQRPGRDSELVFLINAVIYLKCLGLNFYLEEGELQHYLPVQTDFALIVQHKVSTL